MNDYAKLERESELCMFGFDSQIAAGQREMHFSGNNPIGQAYCDFFFFFPLLLKISISFVPMPDI